ncbi:MAG: MFS transporter [Sphingomonadales bacterium]|nr:MFS transporter [Sphingomonadales bacterium]
MQTGDELTPSRYARSPAYRWYAVGVLMLIYMSHAVDRSMPSILTEPIRAEFGLSDAQLGLFTGVAYGLALAAFVLPMGYFSDRVHRRNFLAVIVFIWSICTALGGFARDFWHLLITRTGVGAAEAGAAPAALPMLMDMFPARGRGLAFGMFYVSANLGAVVASAAGGYMADHHGWRTALFVAGAPGIFAALLLFFTVEEPRRGEMEEPGADGTIAPVAKARFVDVLRFIWHKPALIFLISGCSLLGLISISLGAWAASFFVRVHGLSLSEVGLLIGIFGGLGGVVAPAVYGKLGDTLLMRNPAWPLRLVWISAIVALFSGYMMLFSPVLAIAVVGYGLGEFLRSGYPPPAYSTLLNETPPHMRGTMTSIVQFTSVLIGFGLGPVMVGMLSDFYGGGVMIRYALATGLLVFIPVVLFLAIASRMLYGRRRDAELPGVEAQPIA